MAVVHDDVGVDVLSCDFVDAAAVVGGVCEYVHLVRRRELCAERFVYGD